MVSGSDSGGESAIIRRTVKLSEVPVSATFTASWDTANLALPLHNQLIGDKRNIVTAEDQHVGSRKVVAGSPRIEATGANHRSRMVEMARYLKPSQTSVLSRSPVIKEPPRS